MSSEQVIEGPWEEILTRSSEFAGKRVRLTVLNEPENGATGLSERNRKMLDDYRRIRARPLTPEEDQILAEFPEERRKHPFSLRQLSEE